MTSSTWVHYKTMRKKMGKSAVVKDFFFSIFNIFRYLLTYFLPITQLFSTNVARSIQCKKLHFSKEILAHYDCTLILTFSNHHNEKIIPALFSAPDEIQWSCSYLSILPLVFVNSSQVCIYYTHRRQTSRCRRCKYTTTFLPSPGIFALNQYIVHVSFIFSVLTQLFLWKFPSYF